MSPPLATPGRLRLAVGAVLLAAISLAACSGESEKPTPWLLFGMDGADWSVIEAMWADGELPHLKSLADRGTRATLQTAYSASPLIWTSIATGVSAERHGIVGYIPATPQGDVPLRSEQRRVPAIWNLMTLVDRPVAVLGWWTTWPVEPVSGVMISDLYGRGLDDDAFPKDAADGINVVEVTKAWRDGLGLPEAHPYTNEFENGADHVFRRRYEHDAIAAAATGEAVASGEYDLVMGYVRSVDVTSHLHFGCWDRPRQRGTQCKPNRVRRAYSAVDAALGSILEAAPGPLNVMVVSDHGFRHLRPALRTYMDFDGLLERFGYLTRLPDGSIDLDTSLFLSYDNAPGNRDKNVRRLPRATDADLQELQDLLLSLRYEDGGPVFRLTNKPGPTPDTAMVVAVTRHKPSRNVHADGIAPFPLVEKIIPLTGAHDETNPGILIAAGPDVAAGELERAHIYDIASTLAYGLGLPVAEDSEGEVLESLFSEQFHSNHPMIRISSWGQRTSTDAPYPSAVDAAIVEELQALGYLNQ